MNYYEINFYGVDHEKSWSFYIKSEKELNDLEVESLLKTVFIGVDGLEQHHIDNIDSIHKISAEEFKQSSGIETDKEENTQKNKEMVLHKTIKKLKTLVSWANSDRQLVELNDDEIKTLNDALRSLTTISEKVDILEKKNAELEEEVTKYRSFAATLRNDLDTFCKEMEVIKQEKED